MKRAAAWTWWAARWVFWAVRYWLPWRVTIVRWDWWWRRDMRHNHCVHRRMWAHYQRTGELLTVDTPRD